MSPQVLTDRETGKAAFYCSTTCWAFGPVFNTADEAEDFLAWLGAREYQQGKLAPSDPRRYRDQELIALHNEWQWQNDQQEPVA